MNQINPSPVDYELPRDVEKFILEGRESARKRTEHLTDTKALAEQFTTCYRNCFYRFTRNEPENIQPEARRQLLRAAIIAAACLCQIAGQLRLQQDEHLTLALLSNGKKEFYLHRTNGSLHPKIIQWLDAAMNAAERKQRPEIMRALKMMFPRESSLREGAEHNSKHILQMAATARPSARPN